MATCFYPISQETKQQVEELKKTVQLFAPLLPQKTSELINNIIGAWQEKNNKEGFLPTKKELVEHLFKNVYKESPVKEELLDVALKTTLEMIDIQEKAIENGTYLKAPNGKRSKLNEKQWLQVRTKAFKDWFGDWENDPENASKVVDPETGEPMVVYHATDADFTTFSYDNFGKTDSGTVGKGFYFSANKDYVKHYGNKVIAVFLNIKEPVDLRGKGYSRIDIQAYIRNDDKIFWAQTNIGQKRPSDGVIVDQLELIGLNNKTYDSVEYVSFDPNQIKSATDNIGTFLSENTGKESESLTNDIRFAADKSDSKPKVLNENKLKSMGLQSGQAYTIEDILNASDLQNAPVSKAFLKRILASAQKAGIKYIFQQSTNPGEYGKSQGDTVILHIDPSNPKFTHVLLHETIHSFLTYAINNPSQLSVEQQKAIEELRELFTYVQQQDIDNIFGAATDIHEFVAELANPNVYAALQNSFLPYKSQNLITRIINKILELLGLRRSVAKRLENIISEFLISPNFSDTEVKYAKEQAAAKEDVFNLNAETFASGTRYKGIDIGGDTIEEAFEKITKAIDENKGQFKTDRSTTNSNIILLGDSKDGLVIPIDMIDTKNDKNKNLITGFRAKEIEFKNGKWQVKGQIIYEEGHNIKGGRNSTFFLKLKKNTKTKDAILNIIKEERKKYYAQALWKFWARGNFTKMEILRLRSGGELTADMVENEIIRKALNDIFEKGDSGVKTPIVQDFKSALVVVNENFNPETIADNKTVFTYKQLLAKVRKIPTANITSEDLEGKEKRQLAEIIKEIIEKNRTVLLTKEQWEKLGNPYEKKTKDISEQVSPIITLLGEQNANFNIAAATLNKHESLAFVMARYLSNFGIEVREGVGDKRFTVDYLAYVLNAKDERALLEGGGTFIARLMKDDEDVHNIIKGMHKGKGRDLSTLNDDIIDDYLEILGKAIADELVAQFNEIKSTGKILEEKRPQFFEGLNNILRKFLKINAQQSTLVEDLGRTTKRLVNYIVNNDLGLGSSAYKNYQDFANTINNRIKNRTNDGKTTLFSNYNLRGEKIGKPLTVTSAATTSYKECELINLREADITLELGDTQEAITSTFRATAGEQKCISSLIDMFETGDLENVDAEKIDKQATLLAEEIIKRHKNKKTVTLNIAGTDIIGSSYSQEDYDYILYLLLNSLQEKLEEQGYTIGTILNSGQTGIEEAAIKAGLQLNIPVKINTTVNYSFRLDGEMADEYKDRFERGDATDDGQKEGPNPPVKGSYIEPEGKDYVKFLSKDLFLERFQISEGYLQELSVFDIISLKTFLAGRPLFYDGKQYTLHSVKSEEIGNDRSMVVWVDKRNPNSPVSLSKQKVLSKVALTKSFEGGSLFSHNIALENLYPEVWENPQNPGLQKQIQQQERILYYLNSKGISAVAQNTIIESIAAHIVTETTVAVNNIIEILENLDRLMQNPQENEKGNKVIQGHYKYMQGNIAKLISNLLEGKISPYEVKSTEDYQSIESRLELIQNDTDIKNEELKDLQLPDIDRGQIGKDLLELTANPERLSEVLFDTVNMDFVQSIKKWFAFFNELPVKSEQEDGITKEAVMRYLLTEAINFINKRQGIHSLVDAIEEEQEAQRMEANLANETQEEQNEDEENPNNLGDMDDEDMSKEMGKAINYVDRLTESSLGKLGEQMKRLFLQYCNVYEGEKDPVSGERDLRYTITGSPALTDVEALHTLLLHELQDCVTYEEMLENLQDEGKLARYPILQDVYNLLEGDSIQASDSLRNRIRNAFFKQYCLEKIEIMKSGTKQGRIPALYSLGLQGGASVFFDVLHSSFSPDKSKVLNEKTSIYDEQGKLKYTKEKNKVTLGDSQTWKELRRIENQLFNMSNTTKFFDTSTCKEIGDLAIKVLQGIGIDVEQIPELQEALHSREVLTSKTSNGLFATRLIKTLLKFSTIPAYIKANGISVGDLNSTEIESNDDLLKVDTSAGENNKKVVEGAADTETIITKINQVTEKASEVAADASQEEYKMLSYSLETIFTKEYRDLAKLLSDLIPANTEDSMKYVGKTYYAYQEPSHIGMMLKKLNRLNSAVERKNGSIEIEEAKEKLQKYMDSLFGNDPLFTITVKGEKIWFNPLMEALYKGTFIGKGNITKQTIKFSGYKEVSKWKKTDYRQAALACFNVGSRAKDTQRAYLLPVISDKAVMEAISLPINMESLLGLHDETYNYMGGSNKEKITDLVVMLAEKLIDGEFNRINSLTKTLSDVDLKNLDPVYAQKGKTFVYFPGLNSIKIKQDGEELRFFEAWEKALGSPSKRRFLIKQCVLPEFSKTLKESKKKYLIELYKYNQLTPEMLNMIGYDFFEEELKNLKLPEDASETTKLETLARKLIEQHQEETGENITINPNTGTEKPITAKTIQEGPVNDDITPTTYDLFFTFDYFMQAFMAQLFVGDPADYKNYVMYTKRMNQIHSNIQRNRHTSLKNENKRITLTYEGQTLTKDVPAGHEAVVTFKDPMVIADSTLAEKVLDESPLAKNLKDDIMTLWGEEITSTDGQAFRSIESYKKIAELYSFNSVELEVALNNIKNGIADIRDFSVAITAFKPFFVGMEKTIVKLEGGGTFEHVGFKQHKNSEAAIFLNSLFKSAMDKSPAFKALQQFMSDTGVDVVLFSSNVKVGSSEAAIFPDQYDKAEVIVTKLKEAVINTPSALSVRNMENYGIASATSDDFVDKKRPRGTQVVRLMPSDLPGVKEEISSRMKPGEGYTPNNYDILLENWQDILVSDSIKDEEGNILFKKISTTEEGEDGEEKTKITYNINPDFKFTTGTNSERFLDHLIKYDKELWEEFDKNPTTLFEKNPTYLLDWFIYGYLLDLPDETKRISWSTYKTIKKEDAEGNTIEIEEETATSQVFDFEYVEYEVEGRKYNAWELKQMYWGLLSANVRQSMIELQKRFDNIETLQKYIFSVLDKSNRYRQELKQAFQIITLRNPDGTTKKVFKFGFSDPSLALDLEPFLFSLLKENVIAQTTAGGDLIQTAAIGVKSLQMRYHATYTDKKGRTKKRIILTREQFEKASEWEKQEWTSEEKDEAKRVSALKQEWEAAETSEEDLYQTYLNSVENLSVAYLECYMPPSMKALLGTALVRNQDTWEIDVKNVPEDLLEAIGYRVPTEGKYSMAVLKIKGFLPPGSSAIMLPHEWILLSGSDFDIDKLYLITKESTRQLKPVKDIYKSTDNVTSTKTMKQLWAEARGRKNLPNNFDALSKEDQADFEEFVKQTVKEQLQKLKHTNLTKYHRLHNMTHTFVCEKYNDDKTVEQNSQQARNNRIFEIQKTMWQHQTSAPNIVTPGTSKKIEEVGNDVMLLENWNTALPLISEYSFYKNLSEDEQKNRLYVLNLLKQEKKYQEVLKVLTEEGDFLSLEARMKAFQDNRDGGELVAPYAVHNANIPILQGYDGFKFKEVRFDEIPYSSVGKICSPNGEYISRVFAAYIQAAVDNGKNPILSKLKQNSDVAYLVAYMGRVGIPVDTAAYFLANPVVQHVFEQMALQNINMGQAIKRTLLELQNVKIEEEGEEEVTEVCKHSNKMYFNGIPKTYLANQIGLSYKAATEVSTDKNGNAIMAKDGSYIRPALNILETLQIIHENGAVLSEQVRETRTDVKKNVGASISQYYSKGTKVTSESVHWGSSNAAYLRTLRNVIYRDFPNLMSQYHPLFSVEKQKLINSLISKYPKELQKEWFDSLKVYKMMKTELLGSLERDTWYDVPIASGKKSKMPSHFNSLNGKITWFAYSFSKEFKLIVRDLENTGIFSMLNNAGISGSIQDHFLQKCKVQGNCIYPPTAKHLTEVQKKVFRDQVTSMLRGEMVTTEQVRKAQELKGMTPTEDDVLTLTDNINRSAQSLMKMVYMYTIYKTGYNGNSQASFLTFMDPEALSFLGQEYINAIHSELTEEEMHNFDKQFRLNSLKRTNGSVNIREELQEPFIKLLKKAQETPINNKTLMVSKEELGEDFNTIELLMKGSLNKTMSFYDKSLGAKVFVDILVDNAKNPSEAYILFFNSKGDYGKYLEYDPNTTVELYKNISYFAELDAFSIFPKMVLGKIAEENENDGINIVTADVVYSKKNGIQLKLTKKDPINLEEIAQQTYNLNIEEIKKEQNLCQ